MSDLENFPVARDPTSTEIDYIEDLYRMGNYADFFMVIIFFPSLSFFSLFFPLILGIDELLPFIPPLFMFPLSVTLMVVWYRKRKERTYTGEPLREVRGTMTVRRNGAGFFPYLHGRLVRVPDQWRDELGELQQPVHALIYLLDEGDEWAALEINGWMSVERDVADDVVSTRTFLRMPGFNPLYWVRARDFPRRYRQLRRKEQHEGLEDAYTESPLDEPNRLIRE